MIRIALGGHLRTATIVALAGGLFSAAVLGGDDAGTAATGAGQKQQQKVTVEPYKARPAPSYRVSLKDGRLFFLTKLDETGSGYVLHTLEGEDIEVDKSEVENIVDLEKK